MHKYELMLILPGTLDEPAAEKRAGEIVDIVKEHGQNTVLNPMGKNRLAYPIKQIRYGYFYTAVFEAETPAVKVLEHKLSLIRDILRGMITHFNTDIASMHKITYFTDAAGVTTMSERPLPDMALAQAAVPGLAGSAATNPAREEKPGDLEEINKKLDDILSGSNIIPGV